MASRVSQGGRGSFSASSGKGGADGTSSRLSLGSGSSSSARRRSGGGSGGVGRSSKQLGRSLQEISIPEGMDEEVRYGTAGMIPRSLERRCDPCVPCSVTSLICASLSRTLCTAKVCSRCGISETRICQEGSVQSRPSESHCSTRYTALS